MSSQVRTWWMNKSRNGFKGDLESWYRVDNGLIWRHLPTASELIFQSTQNTIRFKSCASIRRPGSSRGEFAYEKGHISIRARTPPLTRLGTCEMIKARVTNKAFRLRNPTQMSCVWRGWRRHSVKSSGGRRPRSSVLNHFYQPSFLLFILFYSLFFFREPQGNLEISVNK